MAAGLGFKTFTTGEVLTAADVNGYLMQGVLVFASAAARNAAITSPQEGQFAFTKDTNGLWYYDGAAWVASGATGDIEGVTAGVGITGGGTSGTVTITNDMATTITASGDIVVGTGSGTYDNLPIGTTNQVLTADTTVSPYKVKWATPSSGGGITLLSTTSISGASTTVSSISGSYKHLWINISGLTSNTGASNAIALEFNGVGADGFVTTQINNNTVGANSNNAAWNIGEQASGGIMYFNGFVYNYSGAGRPSVQGMWGGMNQFTYNRFSSGFFNSNTAVSSIKITANNTTMTAGTLYIYGVN